MFFKRLFIVFLLGLMVVSGCGGSTGSTTGKSPSFFGNKNYNIEFSPTKFSEGVNDLSNPYRGFYFMVGVGLTEDNPGDVVDYYEERTAEVTYPLVLIQFNMAKYRNAELSPTVLTSIDKVLESTKKQGKKAILRFHYDWDGEALEYEPENRDIIAGHMKQFGPVVNRHTDTVFIVQGLCTGNYGEMNNTNYSSDEDITFLCNTLAQCIDPSIFLAVRTPAQLRTILNSTNELSEEDAYKGLLNSRLGIFNDGMLGSAYDLGSYDDTPRDLMIPGDTGTREEELLSQENMARFIPLGGEAVTMAGEDTGFSDFDKALPQLRQTHVSYLNVAHDINVINKWEGEYYYGDGPFDGFSAFDYIKAYMGYRYLVSDAKINDLSGNNAIPMEFTIDNVGFASCYREFTGNISVYNATSNDSKLKELYSVDFGADQGFDTRKLYSGSSMTFNVDIPVKNLKKGSYRVVLKLNDKISGTAINFANNYSDLDANGNLTLGILTLN